MALASILIQHRQLFELIFVFENFEIVLIDIFNPNRTLKGIEPIFHNQKIGKIYVSTHSVNRIPNKFRIPLFLASQNPTIVSPEYGITYFPELTSFESIRVQDVCNAHRILPLNLREIKGEHTTRSRHTTHTHIYIHMYFLRKLGRQCRHLGFHFS